jgi:YjbE family integral membrane protein
MTGWQWAETFGSIILLDLVLSGDNALVLGVAAARLPRRLRMYALCLGGAGAILLRIILSSVASMIFTIPWIQTAGGCILFWIAIRLLNERRQQQVTEVGDLQTGDSIKEKPPEQESFKSAVLTIFIADITMSLDNVLAIGAAANGAFLPLALGLILSIIIILCGSALIAELMTRLTWLLDAAVLILAWTGGAMIRDDLYNTSIFKEQLSTWPPSIIPLACAICMIFIVLYFYGLSTLGKENRNR